MKRENYKSDLRIAVQLMLGGVNIPVPDHDFMLRFYVQSSIMSRKYDCTRKGDVWTNCYERDGKVICCLDNHKFSTGMLGVEYYDYAPAEDFPDGNYLKVVPRPLEIELITGAGDDAEEIDASIVIDIESAISDAQTATVNANTAATNANSAAEQAISAANAANEATTLAQNATSQAETATENAQAATTTAQTATQNANNAAVAANSAADRANDVASQTEIMLSEADAAIAAARTATTNANTAANNANNAAERAEEYIDSIDIDNYYTTSEINEKFADIISGKSWIVVAELPQRGNSNYIYLVPNGGGGNNAYDEYVWLAFSGKYEKIGSTTIDLSNYYTKAETDALLGDKQDTIDDLAAIRSGAALGATALQSETDPTVPSWAKASSKPSYAYSEISGTPTFKTINGKSVLGEGDITIEGGGGSFVVSITYSSGTYTADKTPAEITAAVSDGKTVVARFSGAYYQLMELTESAALFGIFGEIEDTFETFQVTSLGVTHSELVYQQELVSGTNIKTINSTSLLGSGNISIPAGADGKGIASIAKTGTSGLVDTYTITYTDGTTSTYTVTNGAQGPQGEQGNSGYSGAAGELEVVNNLTQGGATAALSAGMGKEIADTTMLWVESENILNPSSITVGKLAKRSTGDLASNSGLTSYIYGVTDFIELPMGGLYCNSVAVSIGSFGCGVVAYDADKNYLDYTSPSPAGAFFIDKTENVHNTWAYVRINLCPTADNNYMVVKGNTLPSAFVPYFVPYYDIKTIQTQNIADKAVTAKKVGFIGEQFITNNILNPNAIVTNSLARNNGGFETSSAVNRTDYILIDENGLYCNHTYYGAGTYGCGAVVYDENKQFVRNVTQATYAGQPCAVAFQSGDAYVIFNIPNEYNIAEVYVCKGASPLPNGYEPYIAKNAVIQDNLVVDTNALRLDAVTPEKTSFFVQQSATNNILNPATIVEKQYVSKLDGSVKKDFLNIWRTDYIPINTQGLFCNHTAKAQGVAISGAAIYDANKNFIRSAGNLGIDGNSLSVSYVAGDAYVIFNIPDTYSTSETYVCRGTQALPDGYEAYVAEEVLAPQYISFDSISNEDATQIVESAGVYPNNVEVVLPDTFYAVVGDTLQLFYQGLVIAPFPRQYDIYANCSIGRGLGRYFETTPTTAGTNTLTLQVFDQNLHLVGSAACNIKVVNAPSNPATNKNVLCIGDSLTAGGYWVCECQRRLKAAGGTPQGLGLTNITFVGNITSTRYGETAKFYGKSGWGWSDFCTAGRPAFRFHIASADDVTLDNVYTNNGHSYTVVEINNLGEGGTDDWTILCSTLSSSNTPQSMGTLTLQSGSGGNLTFTSADAEGANLLWDSDNNQISFKKYCTTNAGMGNDDNLDYLMVLLTGNQLPHSENPSDWATIVGYMKDMFDAVHADYPTCKVKLMAIHFPYIDTYISPTIPQHTFAEIRQTAFMNKLYQSIANDATYSSFVEFVNTSGQVDSQYNFPFTAKPVNTRNSTYTENFVNNVLHPAESGYKQFADAAYRVLCAALNE